MKTHPSEKSPDRLSSQTIIDGGNGLDDGTGDGPGDGSGNGTGDGFSNGLGNGTGDGPGDGTGKCKYVECVLTENPPPTSESKRNHDPLPSHGACSNE